MIQRMKNYVTITVPGVDMHEMTNIEVTIEQESTGKEFTYSGGAISLSEEGKVIVEMPKDDAATFDTEDAQGQVMFTRPGGIPDASRIFRIPVYELLKDDGYGD